MTPSGFSTIRRGPVLVSRRDDLAAAIEAAGLLDPDRLDALTSPPGRGSGRGAVAFVRAPGCPALAVKKMRRGGLSGPLWRDRFAGTRRLRANVEATLAAIARGVATPPPVFLVAVAGPPGLWRAWLATESVEGARDLAARLAASSPADDREIRAAIGVVRGLHDAGIDHRDLNLGNVLVRTSADGAEAFVVDMDRARIERAPLAFSARQRALRRIERSYVKRFGNRGPLGAAGRDVWYRLYAEGNPILGKRLAAGRSLGRLLLAAHRLSWRLQGGGGRV